MQCWLSESMHPILHVGRASNGVEVLHLSLLFFFSFFLSCSPCWEFALMLSYGAPHLQSPCQCHVLRHSAPTRFLPFVSQCSPQSMDPYQVSRLACFNLSVHARLFGFTCLCMQTYKMQLSTSDKQQCWVSYFTSLLVPLCLPASPVQPLQK